MAADKSLIPWIFSYFSSRSYADWPGIDSQGEDVMKAWLKRSFELHTNSLLIISIKCTQDNIFSIRNLTKIQPFIE